jgi:hypothetical protein
MSPTAKLRTTTMLAIAGLASLQLVALTAAKGNPPGQPVRACQRSGLAGSFKLIPNSGALGSVEYLLKLRNTGSKPCLVSQLPALSLLGKTGNALPTHVLGAGKASKNSIIGPGRTVSSPVRLSPDIPSGTEPMTGACEPTSYKLQLTPSRGATPLKIAIHPPTPVCEHGELALRNAL